MPVCECGNIPVAKRLIMKGLSVSQSFTFLLAAPIINPVTIIATYEAFKNVKNWNTQVNNFFQFMMDNFETELVIMGTKLALSTYKLPLDPDEIACFDAFHAKFGKYIAQATEK
jgi:hypothetical protein